MFVDFLFIISGQQSDAESFVCRCVSFLMKTSQKNMKKKGSLLLWSLVRKENAMLKE